VRSSASPDRELLQRRASVERAWESERQKSESTLYLSLPTALIAVVALLESGANSNDAILEKNEAVLSQSRASDQWALYQAKAMRAAIASGESEFSRATSPELAGKFRDEAARLKGEQASLEAKAPCCAHAHPRGHAAAR
jgi:hypothetical protein